MKHLRKSFLTLLALTLFGGAGAWAQGPTQVTEITTDMLPASWATDDNDLTLADLQALGFVAVDASVAQAWTGAPQGEYSVLIYGFDAGYFTYILFDDNGHANLPSHTGYSKRGLYENVAYGNKHFFTAAQEIELTKAGANQWTLGQTPDYDLELQVEYYEAHALKNIPAGWTVMVNGVPQQTPYQGDSLMITETDTVTLIPDGNPRRVKSVTLTEVPSAVLVESITLNKTATTILAGSTETLSVSSVTPDDATDQSVTWSSDNTDVATVGATTGEVTAVAFGTANITATANDGSGVTATCAVTVSPRIVTWNPSDIVPENPGDHSFTKDGITITAATCDFQQLTFSGGGTFTTTLGNFTKIEISADFTGNVSGTGWSNDGWQSATWTGNAASVSFSGDIWGGGMTCGGGNLTIVFTFEQ